jgi:hypothetical protein
MAFINQEPTLKIIVEALEKRIRKIEQTASLQAPVLAADPGKLFEGMLWYRSDLDQFKAYQNSAVRTLIEGTEGAWVTYVPTVTASTGTFTTVSATGQYAKHGRLVTVSGTVTITTNGTAAGVVRVSLPFTSGTNSYVGAGRENASTGNMLQVVVAPSAALASISTYNNLYPGATGYSLLWTVTYESAT